MRIEGKETTADPRSILSCPVDDLPEKLSQWQILAAMARREAARVDAEYRAWRATAQTAALANDPKLSEWKLKGQLEADPDFTMWKQGAATATFQAEICEAMATGLLASIRIVAGESD